MIDLKNKILSYNKINLISFLRFEAGLSNPNFGGLAPGVVGGKYNLRLQQHPEEYSNLLLFLRNTDSKSYLELGVGQGGSFFLNSLMQQNLEICHAVDDCDYQRNAAGFADQSTSIQQKVLELKESKKIDNVFFYNMTSALFFKTNKQNYDIIFIDADHRYEGVKRDYENAMKILNPNGYIIFHDIINYNENIGVPQLWNELNNKNKIHEFKDSAFAGIGIYKPNKI